MNVICFGDSNTYGFDPRSWLGSRYDSPWVDILREKTRWTVRNEGMNGREIPIRPVPFPEDTDLLIVMLGTNDLLQGSSPESVCDKMERFLQSVNLDRQKILLISPVPMTRGEWVASDSLVEASRELAPLYQALGEKMGTLFADPSSWGVSLVYDGVHFSESGHSAFAERLIRYLKTERGEAI